MKSEHRPIYKAVIKARLRQRIFEIWQAIQDSFPEIGALEIKREVREVIIQEVAPKLCLPPSPIPEHDHAAAQEILIEVTDELLNEIQPAGGIA